MAITFYKVRTSEPAVAYLTLQISRQLAAGKNVLWLVAGGSSISVAVDVATNLSHANTHNLTVSLTDERYGPTGHADSNWEQLLKAGFSLPNTKLVPVLTDGNTEQVAKAYAGLLTEYLAKSDYSVALAGVGADGHTFGIKAHSPAAVSDDIVVAYEWEDYVRLTPTLSLIRQLDEVVVYAIGDEKHGQLKDLERSRPITDQPAQLLKHLRKVVIFNDYKGKEL